jgi:hypothetical protein
MIRALRKRHFWMMLTVALIVPALVVMALLLRRPLPKPDRDLETVGTIRPGVAPVVED